MKLNKPFALLLGMLIAGPALSGPISDAFSTSVFAVPWGANADTIKAVLPGAKYHEASGFRYFEVIDGRTIFGLERGSKDKIIFSLDSDGQFSELNIEFPLNNSIDFNERLEKFKTLFGAAIGPNDAPMGLSYEWPVDDGLKLKVRGQFGVFGIGGGTYVTVKKQLEKPRLNKAELGL